MRERVIGGIVLAAGEGRRFGGPKQLAELRGRPLVEHALAAMFAVPAIEYVAVVLGAHADEVAARVAVAQVATATCDEARGDFGFPSRGAECARGRRPVVLTLGDQPFITPQVIPVIMNRVDASGSVARATYDVRPGHPVLIKRQLCESIQELGGDAGARDLLVGAGVRSVECGHLCRPDDIATRDDLEAARRLLAVEVEARG